MDDLLPTNLEIKPSLARVIIGAAAAGGLGCFVLWIAIQGNELSGLQRVVVVILGLLLAAAGWLMARNMKQTLVMNEHGLSDGRGTVICSLDQIVTVERGLSVLKPSNGFVVTIKDPMSSAWVPGVWWRYGRRIALGGLLPGGAMKVMAATLEHAVNARKAKEG